MSYFIDDICYFNKFNRKWECIVLSTVTWVKSLSLFMSFKIYNFGQIIFVDMES